MVTRHQASAPPQGEVANDRPSTAEFTVGCRTKAIVTITKATDCNFVTCNRCGALVEEDIDCVTEGCPGLVS